MKKVTAILLVTLLLLFSSCSVPTDIDNTSSVTESAQSNIYTENLEFTGLDDPDLISYFDDVVYTGLIDDLRGQEYFIENVESTYISKEYLEEKIYNSQENIYFGYNLSTLEEQFEGNKYIFTVGENSDTVVKSFEGYDDSFEKNIIKNVAIGSGVILTCVTVSLVTGGTGAAAISMIFASSAKTATTFAVSGALLSGVSAGIVTGIQTKNFDKAIKTAATKASEGFKWGAISGVISGGAKEAIALKGATLNGLTMNQAAAIQKESGYPLDVIKQFKSMDQYEICKKAGLKPQMINGKTALIRDIDPNFRDEFGRTNVERMNDGLAAIDPSTGESYQLHHIGQKNDSTLSILTESEHMQNGNDSIWHDIGKESEIDRAEFRVIRKDFWKAIAVLYM